MDTETMGSETLDETLPSKDKTEVQQPLTAEDVAKIVAEQLAASRKADEDAKAAAAAKEAEESAKAEQSPEVTMLQEMREELDALKMAAAERQRGDEVATAMRDHGLPDHYRDFLTGKTGAELTAAAAKLAGIAQAAGAIKPPAAQQTGGNEPPQKTGVEAASELVNQLFPRYKEKGDK